MVYVPKVWADGVNDPVNATNLNHIEQGIQTADAAAAAAAAALAGKEDKAAKGVANGYAPLDATTKVPVAFLPPTTGADLSFDGDYVPATMYADGDVVVKDGVAFMCVGGPTNTPPDVSLWGLALTTASIGTVLPAAPVDGQEFVLVDSLTAPTYAWTFKYVAGILDANKWIFIGGSPLRNEVATQEATTSAVYVDLATIGPSFTIPRAGLYEVEIGYTNYNGSVGGLFMSYSVAGAAAVDADGVNINTVTAGNVLPGQRAVRRSLAAGATLLAKYRTGGGAALNFSYRFMRVTPVRVA